MVIFRARRANLKIGFWSEETPLSTLAAAGFMKYAG
jgi:hypothetical protein